MTYDKDLSFILRYCYFKVKGRKPPFHTSNPPNTPPFDNNGISGAVYIESGIILMN